jgi:hypothetical protein
MVPSQPGCLGILGWHVELGRPLSTCGLVSTTVIHNRGRRLQVTRLMLIGVALLALAGAITGTAMGRGGDWTPVVAVPFDTACGTTTVHVTFPVNKEFEQVTTNADDTQVIKVTGSLKVGLATDGGNSLTVNASGPTSKEMFDPTTGDLDFIAQGQSMLFLSAAQSAATGLPQIFTTDGPVDVLFRSDGTVQVNQLNLNTVTDLCGALTG